MIGEKRVAFCEQAAADIWSFMEAKRASLQTFWEWAPSEAMTVKQVCERRLRELDFRAEWANRAHEGAND